jgi:para-aminobenzoate synthetase component 1
MNAPVCLVAWDAPAPAVAFARLEGRRGIFWLDSRRTPGGPGRFSILGCEPFGVFRAWADTWEFAVAGRPAERGRGDPGDQLERLLAGYQVADDADRPVPFCGGAVGFLGYGFGGGTAAAGTGRPEGAAPDAHFGWYDAAAVWDHEAGRAWIVGVGWRRPAAAAAGELTAWLAGRADEAPAAIPVPPPTIVRGDFTREQYVAGVGAVRARIARGEIYQMNLAQRFFCRAGEPPAQLYRRLRELNPAPMGAYLEAGDWTVLSSSPERFLEVQRGRIRTFPIKGTRPRGRTPGEDERQRGALAASEKERAELLMIVDLLRNDLGRVCRFGSVHVRRLHDLATFATVHHLVGEVEGELRPGVGAAELLRAVFPGGSITGAPKVSAMRVIAELEPVPRGIFSGSIGYWSADGRIDLNIAIRTIVCHRGEASFHVGAGIVWDSNPEFEYEETLAKGEALLAALGGEWPGGEGRDGRPPRPGPASNAGRDGQPARAGPTGDAGDANGRAGRPSLPVEPSDARGVFETVRVAGGEPICFGEHVQRFALGCAYFGLTDAPGADALRAAAAEAIQAAGIADGVLRWSAWAGSEGKTEWSLRVEAPRPHQLKSEWKVAIWPQPLPLLGSETACKHLGRKAWRDALAAVRAAGIDEVLLADGEGRIVEGAVSNVFCVRGGRLLTPALSCHPLPGIVRAKVLALARQLGLPAEEGALTASELRTADEVFLTNALIGVRPVSWLDGRQLPAPGPVTLRLQTAFRG